MFKSVGKLFNFSVAIMATGIFMIFVGSFGWLYMEWKASPERAQLIRQADKGDLTKAVIDFLF